MSLHYLVKCVSAKIALLRIALSKLPCKTQPFATVARGIRSVVLALLWHWQKDIHSGYTPKKTQNDQLYAPAARKKDIVTKRLHLQVHTWSTFNQSLMTLVSKLEVVDSMILVDLRHSHWGLLL